MRQTPRLRRLIPRTLALASLLIFAGCLNVAPVSDGIGLLVISSGNNQTIAINSTNVAPLVIKALDNTGAALPGATVTWTISQGTGTLSASTTLTDDQGLSGVSYASGNESGQTFIKATCEGLTVTFSIQVGVKST